MCVYCYDRPSRSSYILPIAFVLILGLFGAFSIENMDRPQVFQDVRTGLCHHVEVAEGQKPLSCTDPRPTRYEVVWIDPSFFLAPKTKRGPSK